VLIELSTMPEKIKSEFTTSALAPVLIGKATHDVYYITIERSDLVSYSYKTNSYNDKENMHERI
jgi:hypothetical protein